MTARAQLPNSPLVEVAFEVKFSGRFAVYQGLSAIQRGLEATHPRLQVPMVSSGEFLDLKPYRFANNDDTEFVQVGLNSLAVITRHYTVFADFKRRIDEAMTILRGVYDPPVFSRVGLRYINLLPHEVTTTATELHPWLSLSIPAPTGSRWIGPGSKLTLVRDLGDFTMRLTTGVLVDKVEVPGQGPTDVFALDIDCFREADTPASTLEDLLRRQHTTVDDTFFGLLSDKGKISMGVVA